MGTSGDGQTAEEVVDRDSRRHQEGAVLPVR
jgi:hypothetical protein